MRKVVWSFKRNWTKYKKKNWEILINYFLLIFSGKVLVNFKVISRNVGRKYGKSLRKF